MTRTGESGVNLPGWHLMLGRPQVRSSSVGRTSLLIQGDRVLGNAVPCVIRGNQFATSRAESCPTLGIIKQLGVDPRMIVGIQIQDFTSIVLADFGEMACFANDHGSPTSHSTLR